MDRCIHCGSTEVHGHDGCSSVSIKPSRRALNAAEKSHYFWVHERQFPAGWREGLEAAIKIAYAVDFAKLQQKIEELEKNQIPKGWICHP